MRVTCRRAAPTPRSDLRNHLVTMESLSTAAKRIGLQHALNIHPKFTPKIADKAPVDALYALVAAIHFDQVAMVGCMHRGVMVGQGSVSARKFARDMLLPLLDGVDVADFVRLAQPRAVLSQLLAQNGQEAPTSKHARTHRHYSSRRTG